MEEVFHELDWSEEAGTGVRNVKKYLAIYSSGAEPSFIEDDIFLTRIPLKQTILGDRFRILLELFNLSDISAEYHDLLAAMTISRDLDSSSDKEEFLQKYMGTLLKNGGNLQEVKILKISSMELFGKENMGSLKEIGGNLFTIKGRKLLRSMIGLLMEQSLEEAAQFSGFENLESYCRFRKSVIICINP